MLSYLGRYRVPGCSFRCYAPGDPLTRTLCTSMLHSLVNIDICVSGGRILLPVPFLGRPNSISAECVPFCPAERHQGAQPACAFSVARRSGHLRSKIMSPRTNSLSPSTSSRRQVAACRFYPAGILSSLERLTGLPYLHQSLQVFLSVHFCTDAREYIHVGVGVATPPERTALLTPSQSRTDPSRCDPKPYRHSAISNGST